MKTQDLQLNKENHDWINGWMELFGAWVYSGRLEKKMTSMIAQWMESAEPSRVCSRPMCNDDDGMLISGVVDSVMSIDSRALGILISYYAHGSSKRAIAEYYHRTSAPRRMEKGRGGEGWRKPSAETCRKEVSQILNASLYMLHQPLRDAFDKRKVVKKVKHVGNQVLTT